MAVGFDHEKLRVYKASLEFIVWLSPILERVPPKLAVHDHLDRASTSIPLNIAEGNGKFSPADRCNYFDTARESALECASALDTLVARGVFSAKDIARGKEILVSVVSMLVGLIKNNSPDRLHEDEGEYGESHSETSLS